jgi:membrane dipeptidase
MLAAAAAIPGAQSDVLTRARALHKQAPLIDGHNDYPWALRGLDPGRNFAKADITGSVPSLMTDIPRLRQGGVGGQFWSVYVPSSMQGREAVRATLEQIDIVHRMARRWPETFVMTRTAAEVERAFKGGKIASMIGMEGGHSIDNSLATLRMLHAVGAGYMTLTHSLNVPWADSATDKPVLGGLSRFGEEVVREMNWLGMLVDLSHVSPDTMEDAIRVSEAPVIFSHSSAKAVANVPRNVPDNVLQMVATNRGIVMITFVPGFISQQVADHGTKANEQLQSLRAQFPNNTAYVDAAMERWRADNQEPRATLSQVADHIDHVRKVAGIDAIGLGGDFDGITSVVQGLEDVSKYPDLTAELLKRGYTDQDIRKILGSNILRVMRDAEQVATALRKKRGPSTATIEQMDGGPKTP